MEETRRPIRYLEFDEIIGINIRLIQEFGGLQEAAGKFANENSLHHLIESIDAESFGQVLYPEIWQKAALYAFNIITRHVFVDGNKRTGMTCALFFLQMNDYTISGSVTNEDITNTALNIANGTLKKQDVDLWFKGVIQ